MRTQCDVCGGSLSHGKCRECGALDAYAPPTARPDPPRMCPIDGSTLRADGCCLPGDGFPLGLPHPPDACPHCRKPLRWDGDCPACLPAGAKPGHRYDYDSFAKGDPRSAHWRIAERGPQLIAPPTPVQRASLTPPTTTRALPLLQRIRELTRL